MPDPTPATDNIPAPVREAMASLTPEQVVVYLRERADQRMNAMVGLSGNFAPSSVLRAYAADCAALLLAAQAVEREHGNLGHWGTDCTNSDSFDRDDWTHWYPLARIQPPSAALAGQEAHMHRPLTLPADRTDRIRRAIQSDDGTSVSARNPQEKP